MGQSQSGETEQRGVDWKPALQGGPLQHLSPILLPGGRPPGLTLGRNGTVPEDTILQLAQGDSAEVQGWWRPASPESTFPYCSVTSLAHLRSPVKTTHLSLPRSCWCQTLAHGISAGGGACLQAGTRAWELPPGELPAGEGRAGKGKEPPALDRLDSGQALPCLSRFCWEADTLG